MLAAPINNTDPGDFRIERTGYWLILLLLAIFGAATQDTPLSGLDFLLLVAWVVLTYARVKDIGWHGAWTIGCLIPLFNIVIGFIRSYHPVVELADD